MFLPRQTHLMVLARQLPVYRDGRARARAVAPRDRDHRSPTQRSARVRMPDGCRRATAAAGASASATGAA